MTAILVTLDAVGGIWRYAMDLGRAATEAGLYPVFAGQGPAPSRAQWQEAAELGPVEWSAIPLDWMAPGPEALAPVPGWLGAVADRHGAGLLHLNMPSQAVGLGRRRPIVVAHHACLATWYLAMRGTVPADLGWHREATGAGLAAADAVLAPSAAHAAAVAACYGIGGIAVVHNASRSPERSWSPGHGVVAVGRWWDDGKNAAVLDAAAGRLDEQVSLIGPAQGPEGQALALRHAQALGALPHAEAIRRLGRAAVFVSPSHYEPFGLAALEAARAGRPLVLSDIPTYRELWDGAATFFDPRDEAALAAVLARLLSDAEARRRLGTAARLRAERYGAATQSAALAALWRRVLEHRLEKV